MIGFAIARGGSTRIKRKNVKMFCGKPLVAWSILQMKCSKNVAPVYLSTDDDEIAEVGEEYGAIVVRRPVMPNYVTGGIPTAMLFRKLIDEGVTTLDNPILSCLPTFPCRLPDDIDKFIELYWKYGPRPIAAVTCVKDWVSFEMKADGLLHFRSFDNTGTLYRVNGAFGISTPRKCLERSYDKEGKIILRGDSMEEAVESQKKYPTPPNHPYIMHQWQWLDIDYLEEFELCEMLMKEKILKWDPLPYKHYKEKWSEADKKML